ncbi:hypothetical protein BDZ89DRAFT_1056732 [Hymenopellis radicata]|nr:hypothetical protein BDZ89DRAFT_1056732 [Hymenopellis radicata]
MASSDRELTHVPVPKNRVQYYSGAFEDSQLASSQIDVLASGAYVPSRSVTAQLGHESRDFDSQTSSSPDSARLSLPGVLAASSQSKATEVPIRHGHEHDTLRQASATASDTSTAYDSTDWQSEFDLERQRIRGLLERSKGRTPEAEQEAEEKRRELLWRDYQLSGGTVSRENFLKFPGCGIRRVCNYPEANENDVNAK